LHTFWGNARKYEESLAEKKKHLSKGKKVLEKQKENIYELFFSVNLRPSWIASEMVFFVFRQRSVLALDGSA